MRLMEFVTEKDVLQHPRNWTEVPRDKALSLCWFELVVTVGTRFKDTSMWRRSAWRYATSIEWIANGFFDGHHDRDVKFYIRKKLDKQAFADYMNAHVEPGATGYCGSKHVQQGLSAGGLDTSARPGTSSGKYDFDYARYYGPYFRNLGADSVSSEGYVSSKGVPLKAQLGNVVVFSAGSGTRWKTHNKKGRTHRNV